jgi:hypothetical protein
MPDETLAEQRARDQALIERTRVPELEILLQQQQLNALVRARRLSTPLLVENGQLDALTRAKQAEHDALHQIEQASIPAQRPTNAYEAEAAQQADWQTLEQVKAALALIPEAPTGAVHDHKAVSRARLAELETQYQRKWGPQAIWHARLDALKAMHLRLGSLLRLDDGGFDYDTVIHVLTELRDLDAGVRAGVSVDDGASEFALGLREFERLVVRALQRITDEAMTQGETPDAESIGNLIALHPIAVTLDSDCEEEAPLDRRARERLLDAMPFVERLQRYKDVVAGAGNGEAVAELAASLVRTAPERMDAQWLVVCDAVGFESVMAIADEAWLKRLPLADAPQLLAVLRQRQDEAGHAARLAGRVAATVLAQDPQKHLSVLQGLLTADEPGLLLELAGHLSDADAAQLPKQVLMTMCKTLGGRGSTAEQRRQMSRLLRLAK